MDPDPGAGEPTPVPDTMKKGKLTLWEELRRRKVWSAAVMYSGAAWAVIGAADIALPLLGINDVAMLPLIYLAFAGLPVVLLLAWAFEIAPEKGVRKTGAWKAASDSEGRSWPLLSTAAKVILALVLATLAVWFLVVKPLLTA